MKNYYEVGEMFTTLDGTALTVHDDKGRPCKGCVGEFGTRLCCKLPQCSGVVFLPVTSRDATPIKEVISTLLELTSLAEKLAIATNNEEYFNKTAEELQNDKT